MSMLPAVCVLALLSLLMVAHGADYPKGLLGTWQGSCQQYATFNGTSGKCTGSSKVIVTYPYSVRFWEQKSGSMTQLYWDWSQDATAISYYDRYGREQTAGVPANAMSASRITSVTPDEQDCGSLCVKSGSPSSGALVTLVPQGKQMLYVEEGMVTLSTNMQLAACPAYNERLVCRDNVYSYKCQAYRIAGPPTPDK